MIMDDQNIIAGLRTQNIYALGIIWSCFTFAIGACVGSFLNVVIYRLPRDLSLVSPGSMCPSCGKSILFYHNIPIFSWLMLGGKCKYCSAGISPRYLIVEAITACCYLGVFLLYFGKSFGLIEFQIRGGIPGWSDFGWVIFLLHMILVSSFLAASAIDLELWVIPLSICWFTTLAGLVISSVAVFGIDFSVIRTYDLLPSAHSGKAALAAGGLVGMIISLIMLFTGLIKSSYESQNQEKANFDKPEPDPNDPNFNHRLEVLKEILFLLPIIICSVGFYMITQKFSQVGQWWMDFSQIPAVAGFTGSLLGYFAGCGIVWGTRILGTLAFGKEAMGLGEVHLMGAAGAVIGALPVVVAFFIAPFFGLAWAIYQMFFKKTRQIPYGPFLSMAVFIVMIAQNPIMDYIYKLFFYRQF